MMGAPNTTPGPWMFGSTIQAVGMGERAGKVAEVSIAFKDSRTRDANGHQMAASPELYDALQQAAAKFREYEAMHQRKLDGAMLGEPRMEVEAKIARNREMAEVCELALAKARGESQ